MMGRNVLMSGNVYLLFQLWREGCADAKVEYSTDMNMSWEILTYIQWRKTPPSINKKRPANPFFTRLGLESRDLGFPRVHRAHTRVALLTRSSGRLAFFRFFLLLNPDDRSPYWLWRWTARKCVGRSFFFSTGIHQTSQIRSTCYTSAASETLIANLESWCAICTSLPPRCLTVFTCYRSWWNLVPFDLLSA